MLPTVPFHVNIERCNSADKYSDDIFGLTEFCHYISILTLPKCNSSLPFYQMLSIRKQFNTKLINIVLHDF